MIVVQASYRAGRFTYRTSKTVLKEPLVLVFGERCLLEEEDIVTSIKEEFPYKDIIFGSTAGEIMDTQVTEGTLAITAIEFQHSYFKIFTESIYDHKMDAQVLGASLIKALPKQGLKHAFVISEGSFVNGSDLVKGLERDLAKSYRITGGLCGDGPRFKKTYAGLGTPAEGEVVVIGFYGEQLEFSYASVGGWTPFGPQRLITRSHKNVLYELDGRPALDLYEKYLGDKAKELPQASLLYPLYLCEAGKEKPVVRTILNIDRDQKAMILAGDVPVNSRVQLMMSSADALLDGAHDAAHLALERCSRAPQLAILVSCVGRKQVLDQRTEEEIEEIREAIGPITFITGFYSYGEIAPFHGEPTSELHNQTMTLTLLSE